MRLRELLARFVLAAAGIAIATLTTYVVVGLALILSSVIPVSKDYDDGPMHAD